MTPLDDIAKLEVELLVLRGAFIEVFWTLMHGDPETFDVERVARAVDRVGRVIEDKAMELGSTGNPDMLTHAIRSVEVLRADMTRGLGEHMLKEPRPEVEVLRQQRRKKSR